MRVAVPLEMCWHDVPGGTARVAIDLTAALADRPGIEVVGVAARHRRIPEVPWVPPVPVRHSRLPRPALYEAWHRLRRPPVESLTGAVDLTHVMAGAVAPSRAPLVVTIHDLAFRRFPGMFTAHGRRFFERALSITMAEAAAVCCSSAATLADCVAAGLDPDRCHHVPLAATPPAEPRGDEPLPDSPYVLFVGTLEPRKNLPRLLDAWRRVAPDHPAARLVVVGPSGWGDALGDRPPPPRVDVLGFVEPARLTALYRSAAVVAYPSLLEGFGLPVLEAMTQGAAVVTSQETSTEELVEGGAGVAVDPTDTDAIAGALDRLLADPDERARLGAAARERAATYTWDRTVERTLAVYRSVHP